MPSSILELPQLQALYPAPLPEKQLMLIAGGHPPEGTWLQEAAQKRTLWGIDRGIESCQQADLKPSRLIGDGDSASKSSWNWGCSLPIPVERYSPIKDLTDTQLALQIAAKTYPGCFVLLTGGFGGRFDHAFSTVYSFAFSGLSGCMADEQEAIFFLQDTQSLAFHTKKRPRAISLLPLSETCTGVSIANVYWPLTDTTLKKDLPYAISNELTASGQDFNVSLASGTLGIYMSWGSSQA